ISVPIVFKSVDLLDYPLLRDKLFDIFYPSGYLYIQELRRPKNLAYKFVDFGQKAEYEDGTDNVLVGGKRYKVRIADSFNFEQFKTYGKAELNFVTVGLPFAESIYTTKELHDTKYNAEAGSLITDKDRERFSDSVDKNEVGGMNLIPNSNDFKSRYLPRNSSEVTFEESYTVEEWSTNEATRIHITGGTDNHRAGATIGNIPKNTEMVHSIYVKNLSEETFTLRFNTEFGGSTGIKIEPLEIKRLVVTGVGRKKYDFVQLHIFT